MKEILQVYKNNRTTIENFLLTTINQSLSSEKLSDNLANYFNILPALEVTYAIDAEFIQLTPYIYKNKINDSMVGVSKYYLFEKANFGDNKTFISNSYISSRSGKLCVTIAREIEGKFIVFDFNLIDLMEKMRLIENNRFLDKLVKVVYAFIGFALMAFAIFLTLYAGAIFVKLLIHINNIEIQDIFKSVIALTLGLAIFDLSKTILEQEVFYKSFEENETKVFGKFMISIIIALSIEALMVVFKIALYNYHDMIYALYLILGISFMIIALGLFYYNTKIRGEKNI